MDHNKPLLNLFLLLLLLLPFCLSLDATPLPRTLALMEHQDKAAIKVADQVLNKEMQEGEEVIVNGRMGIELDDYPGSGPNSRHDPKNPGKP